MALPVETIEQLKFFINMRWKHKNCLMCDANAWSVEGYVTLVVADNPSAMTIGGPSLPCAALVCKNCGNTVLVNLIVPLIVPSQCGKKNG